MKDIEIIFALIASVTWGLVYNIELIFVGSIIVMR